MEMYSGEKLILKTQFIVNNKITYKFENKIIYVFYPKKNDRELSRKIIIINIIVIYERSQLLRQTFP